MAHPRSREVARQLRLGTIQLVEGDSMFGAVRLEILLLIWLAKLDLIDGELARA
jgi:hypothetical protein